MRGVVEAGVDAASVVTWDDWSAMAGEPVDNDSVTTVTTAARTATASCNHARAGPTRVRRSTLASPLWLSRTEPPAKYGRPGP